MWRDCLAVSKPALDSAGCTPENEEHPGERGGKPCHQQLGQCRGHHSINANTASGRNPMRCWRHVHWNSRGRIRTGDPRLMNPLLYLAELLCLDLSRRVSQPATHDKFSQTAKTLGNSNCHAAEVEPQTRQHDNKFACSFHRLIGLRRLRSIRANARPRPCSPHHPRRPEQTRIATHEQTPRARDRTPAIETAGRANSAD